MRLLGGAAVLLVAFGGGASLVIAGPAVSAPERDDQPVLIRGSRVPPLLGEPLTHIRLYRYREGVGFTPMPYQIDERIAKVFNPSTPYQFVETIYDVLGEDDGVFDDDDEIALLFGDAGDLAPDSAPWPEEADPARLRVEIRDPRPDAPVPSRWVYVYTGDGLPDAPVTYVDWTLAADDPIRTDSLELEFEGNWLLTALRVPAPCGTGEDLIDRVKGRAYPLQGNVEDEEGWSLNSTYLGGLVGPVRAIRYVRGATSGVNTMHHDVVYRRWWTRHVNLRVHPLSEVRLYVDLLPIPGTAFYSPAVPTGVAVDGLADAVAVDPVDWTLVTGPAGGFTTSYDVPPTPLFGDLSFRYSDDLEEDDRVLHNPTYGDEDDSSYGAHGTTVTGIGDCNVDPVTIRMEVEALCSGEGDSGLGAAHRRMIETGFEFVIEQQTPGFSPIRSLEVEVEGDDVRLQWQAIAGAATYRVYRSTDASIPKAGWLFLGESVAPEFVDPGGAAFPLSRYYSIRAVDGEGNEGDW